MSTHTGIDRLASFSKSMSDILLKGNMLLGGPIWIAPMHNKAFVRSLIRMFRKPDADAKFKANELGVAGIVEGLLHAVEEEVDAPLYYSVPSLCRLMHCSIPPMVKLHAAIVNAGFEVSQSHCDANAIKTNADSGLLYDVLKAWIKQTSHGKDPTKKKSVAKDSAAMAVLSAPMKHKIDFGVPTEVARKVHARHKSEQKINRWAPNPKKNWGPKSRATGSGKQQTHPKPKQKKRKEMLQKTEGSDNAKRPKLSD